MVIFTPQECEYIKSFYYTEIEHNSDTIQECGKFNIKFSNSLLKYSSTTNKELIQFLENKLNQHGIKSIPLVKFVRYNKGDKMARHTDFTKYGANKIYKTYLFQLSSPTEYTGGDLIVGNNIQSKEQGCMFIINPTTPHEVTEVLSGERMSFVLFLYEENLNLQKTLL